MPSKTPKQARLMAAVAHDPGFAKKAGIPIKVGKEFNQADAGTGILKGTKMKKSGEHHKMAAHHAHMAAKHAEHARKHAEAAKHEKKEPKKESKKEEHKEAKKGRREMY